MLVLRNAIEFLPGKQYIDYQTDIIPKTSTSELIRSSLNTDVYLFKEKEELTEKWNATVNSLFHRPKAIFLLIIAAVALARIVFRRIRQN
jgi:hypothetical protein